MGLCERVFGMPYWSTLGLNKWMTVHKDWIKEDIQIVIEKFGTPSVRLRGRTGFYSSTEWIGVNEMIPKQVLSKMRDCDIINDLLSMEPGELSKKFWDIIEKENKRIREEKEVEEREKFCGFDPKRGL